VVPACARLLFLRDGTFLSQPFDVDTLQVRGEPTPIVERVGGSGQFGFFSASSNDGLVYRTGLAGATNIEQLTWLDRKGQPTGTVGEPRPYSTTPGSIALSPDGSRAIVAVALVTPSPDLWVVEFARGISTRFTFHAGADTSPVWSPDGARVLFRSNRQVSPDLYEKDGNGTADETVLLSGPEPETPTDWSRDGRFVLFVKGAAPAGGDIWILSRGSGSVATPLPATPFNEISARFSPDGRWIAYLSNESGQNEIYLRPFTATAGAAPSVGAKWQVSNSGSVVGGARWRRDGKELFYRHPNGALMSVDVSVDGAAVRTSLPRQLFLLPPSVTNWDVLPDGQRFLVSMPVTPQTTDPISVVLNWQAALKP
jgi:eukaryotic-like serine/threonine-protein kinase